MSFDQTRESDCQFERRPKLNVNKNENENKNATGEATYGGALRAPLAGSPARNFAFVFVLIYV